MSLDLDHWWDQLRTSALVGTARREAPDLPGLGVAPRAEASRETRLLDAAALGDAARRAGSVAEPAPAPDDPAPAETLAPAPSPAVQVLDLLLSQGPVAAGPRDQLVRHWLDTAAAAGRVAPPRLVPSLLDLGPARTAAVRRSLAAVVGVRGRWLAARNPAWEWLAAAPEDAPADDVRVRIARTWGTDHAQARAASVAALGAVLGPDDEAFLERCLDDRARAVREEAQRLLNRLPGSARARRMADRLRSLLSVSGTVRKQLDVRLPDDPDPAAVRDGLTDAGGGSRRARWLRQIVAGAPLTVWTEVARTPEQVLRMLRDPATVLPGLREATAAQRDVDWARALLHSMWSMQLLVLLPDDERDRLLADRIPTQKLSATPDIHLAPRPWGPRTSRAVLAAILRGDDPHGVRLLRDVLPEALDPATLPDVERALRADGLDPSVRSTLRDALQYQSLHRSISEAFR